MENELGKPYGEILEKLFVYLLMAFSFGFIIVYYYYLSDFYFHTDDAFITYTFAMNLAQGHGIVFHLTFEPIQGSSSFLHTVLLAGLSKMTFLPVHVVGMLLSVTSYVASLVTLIIIMYRHTPVNNKAILMVVFILSIFFQLPLIFSLGLETTFIMFLLLLCLYSILGKKPVNTAILLCLIPITRLDYLFFCPALLFISYLVQKDLKKSVLTVVPAIFITLGYVCFSKIYFGEFVPFTWIAKRYFPPSVSGLMSWTNLFSSNPSLLVMFSVFCIASTYTLLRVKIHKSDTVFLSFLLLAITSFLYDTVLELTGAPNMPWYYVPTFSFLYYMCVYIFSQVFRNRKLAGLLLITGLAALNVWVNFDISQPLVYKEGNVRINKLGHNDRREKIGVYLRDNVKGIETKKVLAFEVGKIPYYSGAKVFDTLALVSREGLEGLITKDAGITFRRIDPDYVVGPNNPRYFCMTFLNSKYFKEHYYKIKQFDDYVLWGKKI